MTATTTQGHQTINLPIDLRGVKIQCNLSLLPHFTTKKDIDPVAGPCINLHWYYSCVLYVSAAIKSHERQYENKN